MPEDAARLCGWWNDGAVMAHAGFPDGLGTTEEKVRRQLSTQAEGPRRVLVIEADGVPVGEMSYHDQGGGVAEIGIKICDASQQGKGYGPLYLKMLIGSLFSAGFREIRLDTNVKNERAQHVYEALGFEKAAVRERAWRDQRGQWQTAVDYVLAPERFVPLEG